MTPGGQRRGNQIAPPLFFKPGADEYPQFWAANARARCPRSCSACAASLPRPGCSGFSPGPSLASGIPPGRWEIQQGETPDLRVLPADLRQYVLYDIITGNCGHGRRCEHRRPAYVMALPIALMPFDFKHHPFHVISGIDLSIKKTCQDGRLAFKKWPCTEHQGARRLAWAGVIARLRSFTLAFNCLARMVPPGAFGRNQWVDRDPTTA